MKHLFAAFFFLLLLPVTTCAQTSEEAREWNRPVKPFRIIDNIYYVGVLGVSSFLITTPEGHILLDGGLPESAPIIRDNIAALGFKLADVKILIHSHAHFDHVGGLAALKEWTGARMIASEADAPQLERGGRGDFHFGDRLPFTPIKVDRRIKDGERVTLGGRTLTARITPGHTRGCTNWVMTASEGGRSYQVVVVGSMSVPGYSLVGNKNYPEIAADYERSFQILKQIPCDVFLAAHGWFFALTERMKKLEAGGKNPFIDPSAYSEYLSAAERSFRQTLERQRQAQ